MYAWYDLPRGPQGDRRIAVVQTAPRRDAGGGVYEAVTGASYSAVGTPHEALALIESVDPYGAATPDDRRLGNALAARAASYEYPLLYLVRAETTQFSATELGGEYKLHRILAYTQAGGVAGVMTRRYAAAVSGSDTTALAWLQDHAAKVGGEALGIVADVEPDTRLALWQAWAATFAARSLQHAPTF